MNLNEIKKKIKELNSLSINLFVTYKDIITNLNTLYSISPQIYDELAKTVNLPTDEDAENISKFCSSFQKELKYIADDTFLQNIINSDSDIINDKINKNEQEESEQDENDENLVDFDLDNDPLGSDDSSFDEFDGFDKSDESDESSESDELNEIFKDL